MIKQAKNLALKLNAIFRDQNVIEMGFLSKQPPSNTLATTQSNFIATF